MKNRVSGAFFCLVFCLFACNISMSGQRMVGTWKEYKSYQQAVAVVETATKVFAVYDGGVIDSSAYASNRTRHGSLMSYSPEDQAVKLYSKSDGLSDVGISHIAYSPDAGALVLVYGQNSNIDILTNDGFTNIASLKDNLNFQDKTVNNLEIDGSLAYLSTAFGIVVLDLKKLEVKATYPLNKNTKSVCRLGQYLYSVGEDGVYRGLLTANLSDRNNWEKYILVSEGEDKNIEKMVVFEDKIVHYRPNTGIYYKDTDGTNRQLQPGVFRKMVVNHNQLVLTGWGYISVFPSFSLPHYDLIINANDVSLFRDKTTLWIAADSEGLFSIKKEAGSADYTINTAGIKVNSPGRDLAYSLTVSQNKLLVTGGTRGSNSGARSYYPGTLMVYENGSWTNFDEKEIEKETGIRCWDFTSAVVDPRNPNHYFVSSWGEGVYEFLDDKFVQRHSTKNSTLESAAPNNENYVRVDGLVYDRENNLYMANVEAFSSFQMLSSNNEWSNLFYDVMTGTLVYPQQIVIDKNNRKWVNVVRNRRVGVFVFDDKGQAPFAYHSSSFTDQQGNSVNANGYFCVAEDLNGTIWVGTDNGPISFTNPTQVAQGRCNRVVISGGDTSEPYYLLYGEKVTAIAIDGGNRKWFGTEGDGVFCVEIDGQDVKVTNFTTDNSMLISDVITSIAIDHSTGEVFIGTDKGLVSYMGEAIAGKTDYSNVYAYPNPVRPAIDNRVIITGLMANSTVKITDLNGNLITQGPSAGGQFIWNCTKRNGQRVSSGIYLVLASTPEGKEGVATKIMVIR